ncbi:UPF0161 protein At3g09310 [Daucus carota subsp. sativus]|uniref:UPF0161 protein At3g09310 n=1 Tax=Daucus carota subsp. sativus TaxID=79200 RepID=UPI0007F00876|nr:PREDICTED: UPF0161 protein At3g09310 [Daucus carota subsp. sativus]XP_017220587.1 PREDICTED: UPF0161 protein At3g09310 [Daucus carota subsp. sativus]
MALTLSTNVPTYDNMHVTGPLNSPKIFNPVSRISSNQKRRPFYPIVVKLNQEKDQREAQDSDEVNSLGVRTALSMLKFYKREISPLMPNSCRYLPTCSEYSMIAYKKYGVAKGTILTAWRLCRCNPLGGSGFDPPRWFGETSPPEE